MNEKLKNFGLNLIIILLIISLGFFAINQFLKFKYNSAFLQTPCELCEKLNPNISLKNCLTYRVSPYENVKIKEDINLTLLEQNIIPIN